MTPGMHTDQATPQQLSDWLLETGERPATFSALVDLYSQNRDRFYQLAYVGVAADAPAWAKEIAELAAMLRRFVRFGFQLDESSKRLIGTDSSLYLGDTEFRTARQFLRELSGTAVPGGVGLGRDYMGTETSSAEMQFNVGSSEERESDKGVLRENLTKGAF